MKFDDKLKDKIDSYFANITADELYERLTQKYGFEPVDTGNEEIIVKHGTYDTLSVSVINSADSMCFETTNDKIALAA